MIINILFKENQYKKTFHKSDTSKFEYRSNTDPKYSLELSSVSITPRYYYC